MEDDIGATRHGETEICVGFRSGEHFMAYQSGSQRSNLFHVVEEHEGEKETEFWFEVEKVLIFFLECSVMAKRTFYFKCTYIDIYLIDSH